MFSMESNDEYENTAASTIPSDKYTGLRRVSHVIAPNRLPSPLLHAVIYEPSGGPTRLYQKPLKPTLRSL